MVIQLLLLGAAFLLPAASHVFHHTWSVHLHKDADPHRVARDLNMVNLGQIGTIPDHYLFRHNNHTQYTETHSEVVTDSIMSHDHIKLAAQQKLLSRKKRTVNPETAEFSFNDQYFAKQWYLYGDFNNVTGAWRQGVTGKGIVVTILDDGLERTHPDLSNNYEAHASIDLNDHDDDPMPRYEISNENKHGTRCAGEVASVANNVKCGVGAAYHSRIGGVRMLDGDVTDAIEAKAIGLRPEFIDIYSASWGPDDDGRTVDGPGSLTVTSFTNGIKQGRDGRGSIFVWASGNGGVSDDNCNCDGYTNSIWTLSIGSASESGAKPWYAEECSSTMAVTYSSGSGKDRQILSTDLHSKCTERHTGTSAAAPLAAGIFALVLQANPLLTWRDLQHLVVRTSRERNLQDAEWATNGAGFKVSHKFGYGVIDAGGLIELAQLWNNVPTQFVCVSDERTPEKSIGGGKEETFTVSSDGCNGDVAYLEHVQCVITLTGDKRGDAVLHLTSPSGTESTLLTARKFDGSSKGFNAWPFLTVHNWGENPSGTWKLKVKNNGARNIKLVSWQLIFHGTDSLPELRDTRREIPESGNYTESDCDPQCEPSYGCGGPGPGNCTTCLHYLQQSTNICVDICGPGEHLDRKGTVCVAHCELRQYVTESGQCQSCDTGCDTCSGPSAFNCSSCPDGLFLNPAEHTCVDTCPENTIAKDGVCSSCHPGCLTCTDIGYDKCLTCQESLFFLDNQCYQSCPRGYFSDHTTRTCVECSDGCTSCYGTGVDQCVACNDDLVLGESQCLANCPQSYFQVPDIKQCRRCHYTCDSCSGVTAYECTKCIKGLFMSESQCVQHCPGGSAANTSLQTCEECSATCNNCYGTGEDQCTSCPAGKKLEEGRCVAACPDGKYSADEEGTCVECSAGCEICSGPTDCSACITGTALYNGECVEVCPAGWYNVNGSCEKCSSDMSCTKCGSTGACSECKDGYILTNDKCVNPCPTGQFLKDGVCSMCAPNCEKCFGEASNQCTKCSDAHTNELVAGYALSGHIWCEGCSSGCELCTQAFNNYCLSCESGKFLLPDKKVAGRATCVESCPAGTVSVQENGMWLCADCHETCAECDGVSSRSCTACGVGHVLEQSACLTQCSESFYEEGSRCMPCDNACKTCNGAGPQHCLSCPPGFIHQDKSCVTSCGSGFFKNGDTCQACHPTCTECNGSSDHMCSACIPGFILAEDRCTNTCQQGLYNDKQLNFCKACHVTCANCTEEGPTNCLTCKQQYFMNPTTSECWPCCSSRTTSHCCFCSEENPTCTDKVQLDKEDVQIPINRLKVTAGVVFGVISIIGCLSLFAYVLYQWYGNRRPVSYTLLSSNAHDDAGHVNEAFASNQYEEEIMTMIHS